MKTREELFAWCAGAARELGDPSIPVGQVFVRFCENEQDVIDTTLFATFDGEDLFVPILGEILPLTLDVNGPRVSASNDLEAFGVEKVIPGVWYLTPSLNIPGEVHVHVVLYGVPEPAPWEVTQCAECEMCGCTEVRPCIDILAGGVGCHWMVRPTRTTRGLCNVCARRQGRRSA